MAPATKTAIAPASRARLEDLVFRLAFGWLWDALRVWLATPVSLP
jgi:hypothetical protein